MKKVLEIFIELDDTAVNQVVAAGLEDISDLIENKIESLFGSDSKIIGIALDDDCIDRGYWVKKH